MQFLPSPTDEHVAVVEPHRVPFLVDALEGTSSSLVGEGQRDVVVFLGVSHLHPDLLLHLPVRLSLEHVLYLLFMGRVFRAVQAL